MNIAERYTTRISDAELARRWERIRTEMGHNDLIVQSSVPTTICSGLFPLCDRFDDRGLSHDGSVP